MRRREFIVGLGGVAAAWPLTARAQQTATPLVGFLGTSTANVPPLIGFRRGLAEAGFVEGRNEIDAFMGFAPEPQEMRAKKIGRVLINFREGSAWS
jgi:hypothetical protein